MKREQVVYVVFSRGWIHGVYSKEKIANFVCDRIDGRVAKNVKVDRVRVIKTWASAGYSYKEKNND